MGNYFCARTSGWERIKLIGDYVWQQSRLVENGKLTLEVYEDSFNMRFFPDRERAH